MDQLSFASLDYATKKKCTKREVFFAETAAVVPWAKLEAVIEPHYRCTGRPAPVSASRHAVHLLPAAVVWVVRSARKKRSTTFIRCARSPAWSSAATRSPTRRRALRLDQVQSPPAPRQRTPYQ